MFDVRRFFLRVAAFARSGRGSAEVTREINAHLQLLEDDFIARGMSAEDARFAARRAFGGQVEQTKLRQRDARSFRWLDESWLDFKLGARMLVKYPGLSIVGGLGLAVSIAIGAAFFAFVYAYLYSTIPVEDAARVIALENWDVAKNNENRQSLHDFFDWRGEMTSVEHISAYRTIERNLIVPGGAAEPIRIAEMSASAFRAVRVAPLIGRTLVDDDERKRAPRVVVIGHDVWQSRFGGDPAVLGRDVRLGNVAHTIVGVMPEGFAFPINHSYWVPFRLDALDYARGAGPAIFIFGRLANGRSMEDAEAELSAIGARAAAAFPKTHAQLRPHTLPYTYPFLDIQGSDTAQFAVFEATVSLLLVIVAMNVAILVYARTATRQGEIAVRTALGASRRRIVAQLFIEALVLSAIAGVVGLGLARVGLDLGHGIMLSETGSLPYWVDLGVPPLTIVYVIGLVILAATLAGVLPALQATGRRVQSTLRDLSGSTGMRLGRTWTLLIVAQVALAVAALPMAAAMGWSEVRYAATQPTFDVEQFLSVRLAMDPEPPDGIDLATYRRELAARSQQLQREVVARLEAEAMVSDVTLAIAPPGSGEEAPIEVEGESGRAPAAAPSVRVNRVAVDFFATFDAALLTGRALTTADQTAAASAIVVNRSFVQRMLGNGNAVGRRVRYPEREGAGDAEKARWYEIVGVVADTQVNALDPTMVPLVVYHPLPAADSGPVALLVRLHGVTATTFVTRVREIATAIDPSMRLVTRPMVEAYRQQTLALRLVALVVSLIVVSVLLLSAAGIYALMSFTVAQRRKEIGIRAALGADAGRLLRSIFARAAGQLGAGVVVGLLSAAALDMLSDGELLGSAGPVLLSLMSVVMLVVGLAAAIGPARRGLRIQPTQALREN